MSFRKEKKYRLTISDMKLLKSLLISQGMQILYPKRKINTCYFDTNNLKMFFESEAGILPRKKIRLRWYGNDSPINSGILSKEKKITSSEGRFKTNTNYYLKNLDELNNLSFFENYYGKLYPNIIVRYQREYFSFKNLRITFDSNILYEDFRNLASKSYLDKENVMEIKTSIFTSEDYIEKLINIQPSRFSKYCRGVENFYNF